MSNSLTGHRDSRAARRRVLGATSALVLGLALGGIRAEPGAAAAVLVRVNQVGYAVDASKGATVMARRPLAHARFTVLDAHGRRTTKGRVGPRQQPFSRRWRYVYHLDFSALRVPGFYRIAVGRARSRIVRIAPGRDLFGPLVEDAITFFEAQRDGPDVIHGVLHRRPAHLRDARAEVYRTPRYRGLHLLAPLVATGTRVDVSGGWSDAGDYLKFVETASFSDVMTLFTLRQYRSGVRDPSRLAAEARFGTDWLLKMWDQQRRVLYFQVGIGDGNARILGDHDLWRLPQADDRLSPRVGSPAYYLTNRPVFAANAPGAPISPNLAGRVAAAFALCAQVFAATDPAYARRCELAGQTIYDQADTHPRGALLTTVPHDYYDEPEWRDDMELAATELYLATQALGDTVPAAHTEGYYLSMAGFWANAYINSPLARGDVLGDSLNLYDVSTLADYDLIGILNSPGAQQLEAQDGSVDVPTSRDALLRDRADQLELGVKLAAKDPFGLANPSTTVDTVPHALGYAIEGRMYDELTHSSTYERFVATQLAWVLGANPWGSSFIVGAGQLYPHCLAHQVANLAGSLTGRGDILLGATVDGPNALGGLNHLGAPDGYRRCPPHQDPFRAITGRATGYRDDVRSSSTSEPTDDYTAETLLAAAQQAGG